MVRKSFEQIENLIRVSSGLEIKILDIKLVKESNPESKSYMETNEHNRDVNCYELKFEGYGDLCYVQFKSERPIREFETRVLKASIDFIKNDLIASEEALKLNCYFDAIGDSNPFYIAIDQDGIIISCGKNWEKTPDQIQMTTRFGAMFNAELDESTLTERLTNCSDKGKILFFTSHCGLRKYKSSVLRKHGLFVLLVQPLINVEFKLSNYQLVLSDFLPHEYIAEFIFLQSSSNKALDDSRVLIEKIKQRNKEIESLSSFPSENPNPILRFSAEGETLYTNAAANENFNHVWKESDPFFVDLIQEMSNDGKNELNGRMQRDGKEFLYVARSFRKDQYVNFYLFDITTFRNEIESLNVSISEQRDFYEQVLNGIPNDIAVFDEDHKYIFVNPKGIQNEEIRKFMIGKTDFDYCRLKGVSDEMAIKRREIFTKIMETGTAIEWEDQHTDKNGNNIFILRKMAPMYNANNEVQMVIGYGVDITKRVEAEQRLVASSQENNLLRKFIEKTNDAIQVVDESGKLIYLNEQAKARLGFYDWNYKGKFVGEFEPQFPDFHSWTEHCNELKSKGSLRMVSQNMNVTSGNIIDVDLSLNWEEINGEGYVIAISRDITEKKRVEFELEQKRKFQDILIETARKYINIKGAEIDEVVIESLAFIGELSGVDRVYIFDYDHVNKVSSNTHEWCAPGIEPEIDNLQQIPFEYIPDWTNAHFNGLEMHIGNVEELEPGILRDILEPQGIKSLLAIPMFNNNSCVGFVGFDSVHKLKYFSDEERNLLSLFAEMLVNMFDRSNYLQEIENSKKIIARQNESLEVTIQEEIKKNLELSTMLTNQDKMSTIGELAAGIAHDLNTPLGSVNVGIESIDYSISRIFETFANQLKLDEILDIFELSKGRKLDIFTSSTRSREEMNRFTSILKEHYECHDSKAKTLSHLLVQCQIRVDEERIIQLIFKMSNPMAALEILYSFLSLSNLINSSKISIQRASQVVQNMRSFIKNTPKTDSQRVNIEQSIKTVLGIFNHEIRKNVTLDFRVDPYIEIDGFEVKLFQLWSNIVKNALEATLDQKDRDLSIYSSIDGENISISISNNGPMIPEELQEEIFNKFFSTKLNKSGTGIGLNIVKTIVEEHNAKLLLASNPELTTFTVIFKKKESNGKN